MNPRLVGHGAMLSFSALVAFSFTLGGMVAGDIAPEVINAVRFSVAIVLMFGLARAFGVGLGFLWAQSGRWLLIGGLMAGYFITMFESLALTTALSTSAVFTLAPLIATLFGWLILGQATKILTLAALGVGAVGALWVIFQADLERALSFDIGLGETLFFCGTIAHALVPAATRALVPDAKAFEAALGTTFGALMVTGLYAVPAAWETDFAALPARVWWVIAYLGIVTTALTFFLLQTAIARLPPGKVMAYTYLVPTWVLLHGWVGGAQVPWQIAIGVGLTFVSLIILLMQDVRARG